MDPFQFLAQANEVKNEVIASLTRMGYSVKPHTIKDEMLSFEIEQGKKHIGLFASPFKLEAGKNHLSLSGFRDSRKRDNIASIIKSAKLFRESSLSLKLT